mmetsp:Transcript_29763/g.39109  ORF Transcript_29763/g.39109 Transcript_29763/m.39109 type:complete len:240 (+) Transcript_29763:155-874(+)|eukprot:CAMPEP_0117757892 /NCGR_PEP_ID=MMETSP0947-20121206/15025_1 /TAXON_ID=44440 /ORGANISM="Chattonella subsalsa, Strain CCMP2191" /LENGTH=239 /DNA_ID=CAMNT_0005577919 /DNA_START=101 /DNA_END=820 /DNA_ORIENTATION=-
MSVSKWLSHNLGKALRESGQALDRLGMRYMGAENFMEHFSRHRQLMPLGSDKAPTASDSTFVAPSAAVIGNVDLKGGCSVWYNAVIRADVGKVTIGNKSNIQDRTVIQASVPSGLDKGASGDVVIEDNVTVGHGAIIYSSTIENNSLIGIGAIISEGAVIGSQAMVAANSVVAPGTVVPSKQLWAGNPAKAVRDLTDDEVSHLHKSATDYSQYAAEHFKEFLLFGANYLDTEKARRAAM